MADEQVAEITKHQRWRPFLKGQRIYFQYVLALIRPGEKIDVPRVHQIDPKPLSSWTAEELALMIEEGRRQSDRQFADLERLRNRAQWLFTVGAAALAAVAGVYARHGAALGFTLLAIVLMTYGVGGAAAVLTVRADFKAIDTAVLSGAEQPIDRSLATSYARAMAEGQNTLAALLTVFRQAAVFLILGGYVGLATTLAS